MTTRDPSGLSDRTDEHGALLRTVAGDGRVLPDGPRPSSCVRERLVRRVSAHAVVVSQHRRCLEGDHRRGRRARRDVDLEGPDARRNTNRARGQRRRRDRDQEPMGCGRVATATTPRVTASSSGRIEPDRRAPRRPMAQRRQARARQRSISSSGTEQLEHLERTSRRDSRLTPDRRHETPLRARVRRGRPAREHPASTTPPGLRASSHLGCDVGRHGRVPRDRSSSAAHARVRRWRAFGIGRVQHAFDRLPRAVPVAVDVGEIDAGEATQHIATPDLVIDDLRRCRAAATCPRRTWARATAGLELMSRSSAERGGEHRQQAIRFVESRPRAVWMNAATVQIRQLNAGGWSRPPVRRIVVAAARSASTSSHCASISSRQRPPRHRVQHR